MEHQKLVEKLLQQDENLCLEFKSYWYWTNEKKSLMQKGWDEFLKDFISMFNTYDKNESPRHFIFGFDEKTGEKNNFTKSIDGNEIGELQDLDELKSDLTSRLESTCSYSSNDIDIADFFEFDVINIDEKKILLLTLHHASFYLTLKRDLSGGMKENAIPVRIMKQNSPSNSILDGNRINDLKDVVEKNSKNIQKREKRSIRKIVEAFQTKHFPSAKVCLIKESRAKSGIYYELFEINSEFTKNQIFVYITSFTSQEKTINNICSDYSTTLQNASNIFLLADKENRVGGTIDLNRIEKLFKDKISNNKDIIKVEYLENFSSRKIYKEELLEEIFSVEKPSSHNSYISPDVRKPNGEKVQSSLFFDDWIKNDESPILVIKGTGGVGKTTVARQFIYKIQKKNVTSKPDENDTKYLFINSHGIINELMSSGKISDLYDFYQVLAEIYKTKKRLNKHTFSLSADNGNLVIVLDGIDEVIAKKGSDFDVIKFMDSITTEYLGSVGKTKIIITCRDSFWGDDLIKSNNISEIEILPFNKELTEQYFTRIFNDKNKQNKAINMASDYEINGSYVPYILDMIREIIISNEEGLNTASFDSKLLKSDKNKHDFLIGKVCEREIKKLDNTNIDEQLYLFMSMALRYSGTLNQSQLKELLSKSHSQKNLTKFNAHPLLKELDDVLSFRYDFFEEYFKELKLCIFLELDEVKLSNLDNYLVDILKDYINYDNDFVENLRKRINNTEKLNENLFLLLIDLVNINRNKDSNIIIDNKQSIISSFFILLLLINEQSKEKRTELLKEIFTKDDCIENLSLINLHSINKKINFDFKNLKFNNCHFENFENFFECDFDEETHFRNSTFLPKLRKNSQISSSLLVNNIDKSTCKYDGLQSYFDEIKEKGVKESDLNDKFVRDVVRFFWKGMGFKILPKQSVHNKFKKNHALLEKLVSISFLKEKKVTTSRERKEPHYYIADEFDGIRKIMEENQTCIEFERVKKIMGS
ncbi:NACHT domain-containing protein [Enterobacter sp. Ap-916]|uniref:NACHT domain-containing protein n=1 Tax=unclassified Enterobacter TaxID=2608935 RepID=UPI00141DCA30|nr:MULTISPECIES: NACHT domain-containing protein [unclassified Enterobacter]NIF56812.1 NACHT domain-containing protein [Enterobacter sp. Ap-867]NIG29247.1 NACHT domain-containing protein [Enterobacter sp. Ap-916]